MKKILNNLKTLNKTAWIIIVSLIVACSTLVYTIHAKNVKQKEEMKAELLEAKKPSEIEIKYKNLTTAEKDWANYENKIQEYTKKKLELEPKIREMRADLLGLKK